MKIPVRVTQREARHAWERSGRAITEHLLTAYCAGRPPESVKASARGYLRGAFFDDDFYCGYRLYCSVVAGLETCQDSLDHGKTPQQALASGRKIARLCWTVPIEDVRVMLNAIGIEVIHRDEWKASELLIDTLV